MHRASAVNPCPKWGRTEHIVRQKSSRARSSRGDYLNQTSIGLAVSVSPEATQKTRLRSRAQATSHFSVGWAMPSLRLISQNDGVIFGQALRQKTSPQVSLAPIFERLKELAQLKADWDSYGAEPVSSVALVTAFELLDAVKERLSRKVREPLPQFIAPLADGGLQLEWSRQQGDIEVEIDPNGDLGYVLIEGQGTNQKFKEQHQVSLNEVLNLLSQFLSLEVKE